MAYVAGKLTSVGNSFGWTQYFYDAGTDGVVTVNTAGYFNNTDDKLNMGAGDEIFVKASDGNVTLKVISVSSGSVTTDIKEVGLPVETGTTTTNLRANGLSVLNSTAAQVFTMDPPYKGALKVLFAQIATTAASHTVNTGSTGITFEGTNDVATFDGAGDCLVLLGLSATRWAVLANSGSVAFS